MYGLPSVRSKWLGIGQVLFLRKNRMRENPAILTEQAWSIKGLLYGFLGNVSSRTQHVVPSGQERAILPAWVANHSTGFDSSCLLTELAM